MSRLAKAALSWMAVVAITLAIGGAARADDVGTLTLTGATSCGTSSGCPNATYNFDVGGNSATLSITILSGQTLGSGNDQIGSVDLGISNSSVTLTGLSVAGPDGSWTAEAGPVSNAGCQGTSTTFVCAQSSDNGGTGESLTAGDTYTWTWDWTGPAIDPSSLSDVHVGANYNPANGLIISQDVAVPEPSSFALLGFGLLGLACLTRRRAVA